MEESYVYNFILEYLTFVSLYLKILTTFLIIVRYKLAIVSYKVQFWVMSLNHIILTLQLTIERISVMWKTGTESQNPVIKVKFSVYWCTRDAPGVFSLCCLNMLVHEHMNMISRTALRVTSWAFYRLFWEKLVISYTNSNTSK